MARDLKDEAECEVCRVYEEALRDFIGYNLLVNGDSPGELRLRLQDLTSIALAQEALWDIRLDQEIAKIKREAN